MSGGARRESLLRDLEAIHDQLKGVGMRSRIEARPTLALRPQQVRVAGLLVLNGPMRSGELATTLGVSRATMTGLVDRLEQAGMVERRVVHAMAVRAWRKSPNPAAKSCLKCLAL
ncbi:MAG: MarR family transcriptional regulator [Bifidobacteriaceae bacterium]|jgi:DNA-binding MarR family transcriptional regulator|nr:MarR family transcriptional regulator [Bifidobacteriaceae bacterium]